jgi:hypothetical protein
MSGFPLAHGRPLLGKSVRSNVLDFQAHEVAAAQFAVDCQIKHREVAQPMLDLQLCAYRPELFGLERWLGAKQFAFVPRDLGPGINSKFIEGLHGRTPL